MGPYPRNWVPNTETTPIVTATNKETSCLRCGAKGGEDDFFQVRTLDFTKKLICTDCLDPYAVELEEASRLYVKRYH